MGFRKMFSKLLMNERGISIAIYKKENIFVVVNYFLLVFGSFALSMPNAWISVTSFLLLLMWFITGNFKLKFAIIKQNPVAVISLGLLALYSLGTLYSPSITSEKMIYLEKYSKLLLIPLIISILDTDKLRHYCVKLFF